MKKKIFCMMVIPFVFFVILSTSCQKKEKQGEVLRFHLRSEPPSLDWSLATDHVSADIIFNIMEGLVRFDQDLNVKPALAESWKISSDGKEYTFYLKKNVKWSDGTPLQAKDFVYSWRRLLNPKTGAEYAYFLYDIEGAKEYNAGAISNPEKVAVKALDAHTLWVKLRSPVSYFIQIPTFWVTFPMREDVVQKWGDHWTEPAHMVTLGPFLLKAWEHDYKLKLVSNPHYHEGKVNLKEAVAFIINEDTTALSLYETGGLEILRSIPAQELPRVSKLADYRHAPFLRGYYYGYNVKKPPFHDKRVRQAFSLAIDRSEFPKILKGKQIPMTSWVPQGMFGFEPGVGLGFDPKRARSLLREAGYDGKGFPKVTLMYDTRDDNKVIAEKLQEFWKTHLGILVNLQNQEWKVYLKQLRTDAPHLFRLGWGADYPDPDNFLNLFTSYSGNNMTNWKNADYDKLIADGAMTFDPAKRRSLYHRAQIILTEEEVPIMPLFMEAQNLLVSSKVKNFSVNAMAIFQLKDVRLEN